MGEMADYYLDRAYNPLVCDSCGHDIDWCVCGESPRSGKLHIKGCKGTKVERRNRATGQPFWGCSEFPKCRWSQSMTPQEAVGEVPNDAWDEV